MNELEVAGVIFLVVFGVIFVWFMGYLISVNDDDRSLGASFFTIACLVIALIVAIMNDIESDRKNDEYEKIISEYEADKEVGNENNN